MATAQKLWDPEPGWLNTASYGLPPRPAFEALQEALEVWRTGRLSWEIWDESTVRSRAAFARLTGVDADDVSVGSTVSQMLGPLVASLPAGTRVVVPAVEFTSNMFPWLAAPQLDVRVVPFDGLLDAIDDRTGVVTVSLVQSADGTIADLPALAEAAHAYGALLVVDATQACGWLPFEAGLADAVFVGGYKWLMAPRGTGFGYLAPHLRERMTPFAAGWYAGADPFASYYGPPLRLAETARRFDTSPAWFSWVAGRRRWSWSRRSVSRRSATTTWRWPTGSWPDWGSRRATARS